MGAAEMTIQRYFIADDGTLEPTDDDRLGTVVRWEDVKALVEQFDHYRDFINEVRVHLSALKDEGASAKRALLQTLADMDAALKEDEIWRR